MQRSARSALPVATLAGCLALVWLPGGRAAGLDVTRHAGRHAAPERQATPVSEPPPLEWFFEATSRDRREADAALARIAERWDTGYAAMIIDMARLMRPARFDDEPDAGLAGLGADPDDGAPQPGAGLPAARRVDPSTLIRSRLLRFLSRQTGQRFGDDLSRWRTWLWQQPYAPHPDYAEFKGTLYAQLDPRFAAFFPPGVASAIRLDEIDWGGVGVNGIPPLVDPVTLAADEARYLRDNHVVFGIVVEGDARAYPKRILAWHELALDRVGGIDLAIVYCTLCGTVIPYERLAGGVVRTLGTSGLLYRSNKLMFDEETGSLWATLDGTPVVGPLVGSGLRLTPRPVVTTTWGEWRRAHPTTRVLSLETGHRRDYAEGAAYRDYFATDRLMFGVPQRDDRLRNKAEVLVVRSDAFRAKPVAVSIDRLRREPVLHVEVAGERFVVLTSRDGANRAYEAGDVRFTRYTDAARVADTQGRAWHAAEDELRLEDDVTGQALARVPAHRVFWFAWFAQYPDTDLIK